MVVIASGIMCLMLALTTLLHRKKVNLGRWRIPLTVAMAASVVWFFYLVLTHPL